MTEEKDLAVSNAQTSVVVHGLNSIFLDMQRFEFAKKVASMLAASKMVPKHFQGAEGVGSCMIAMNLAERMGVDVFMLMQSMYVVHGRPGLEGKLVIALVNGGGRFEPLEFEKEGEGKTDKNMPRPERVRAFAKELKSAKVLYGPWVTWDMAKIEGWTKDKGDGILSKWQTMPEVMFHYRSATFFARIHCPEVLMGLKTKEELDESIIEVVEEPTRKIEGGNGGKASYEIKTAAPTEDKPPVTPPTEGQGEGLTMQQSTLLQEIRAAKPRKDSPSGGNFKSLILGKREILESLPEISRNLAKGKWMNAELGPWPLDEAPKQTTILTEPPQEKPETTYHGPVYCPNVDKQILDTECDTCEAGKSNCPSWQA